MPQVVSSFTYDCLFNLLINMNIDLLDLTRFKILLQNPLDHLAHLILYNHGLSRLKKNGYGFPVLCRRSDPTYRACYRHARLTADFGLKYNVKKSVCIIFSRKAVSYGQSSSFVVW